MTRSGVPATGLAAARDADIPDVLGLLEQPGCVLCRTCEDATRTWIGWFCMENNNDPALLETLERSAGFCPAHTRRLLTETSARILRSALASALSGAIRRAEQAAARLGRDKPGRLHRATVPCPLCRVTVERVRAAAGDLAAFLDRPQVAAAIRDRGGLCFRHLRHLLPKLSSTQAVSVADAVASRLFRPARRHTGEPFPAGWARPGRAGPHPLSRGTCPHPRPGAGRGPGQYVPGCSEPGRPTDHGPGRRLLPHLPRSRPGTDPLPAVAGPAPARVRPRRERPAGMPQHLHDTQSAPGASASALSSSSAAAREQALGLPAGATALTGDRLAVLAVLAWTRNGGSLACCGPAC